MLITRCNVIWHSDKYCPNSLITLDTLFGPLCSPLCLISSRLINKYLQADLICLTRSNSKLSIHIIFHSFEPKACF